jgi:topoisomerase-4 subunit A
MSLMEGLEEESVNFTPSYNGEYQEPLVLPSAFPNVLANGATGIAVGMATNIPPHNLHELCDALCHLLKHKDATTQELMAFIQGPDFPTGGVIVEPASVMAQAYGAGRGSFRLRAKWQVEPLKNGQYQLVVTEIPYQVQKARLIERIADLWGKKKLPLLADIRDESAEDVRLVFIPKSKSLDPLVIMESLFKQTDLEQRFNLNMNVLQGGRVPRVMSLDEVLKSFLAHRFEVLQRRSQHRIRAIIHRLEVLDGFLIVYLNLDEVIRIIRFEEDPKDALKARWPLTDIQVEAILNMRLRALRKLEEQQITQEYEKLKSEKEGLEILLGSESKQAKSIERELKELQKKVEKYPHLPARRTQFEAPPQVDESLFEPTLEREPITIVCSQKGWIRALKGHHLQEEDLKYKEGDGPRFILKGETIDKLILISTFGRFYTLAMDKLPGGRTQGEPVGLMIDMAPQEDILDIKLVTGAALQEDYLLVSEQGRGFMVRLQDVVASTRGGKQVFNASEEDRLFKCLPLQGTHIGMIGKNRKILFFESQEVPRLTRGKGVILQRYKGGGVSDVITLNIQDGMRWRVGERVRFEPDLRPWLGKRATAGRLAPLGFPRSNHFILLPSLKETEGTA